MSEHNSNDRRPDNRPSWMSNLDQARNQQSTPRDTRRDDDIPEDSPPKRNRLYVMSASLLKNTVTAARHMPLDLDNGLPGILIRFGTEDKNESSFVCLVDTCAAMNTGNLKVHQWIMTQYPEIVAEYVQYDDEQPFQPLKLECAVKDIPTQDDLSGNLTAIVRYWTRYTEPNGQRAVISFGLGRDIAVNSIIGVPTIRKWGMSMCFMSNTITAHHIKVKFSTVYERSKNGLPSSVEFDSSEFIRPGVHPTAVATALVTNLTTQDQTAIAITDGCEDGALTATSPTVKPSTTVTDDDTNGYLRRVVSTHHLE